MSTPNERTRASDLLEIFGQSQMGPCCEPKNLTPGPPGAWEIGAPWLTEPPRSAQRYARSSGGFPEPL
jgi:hypothetical protein